MCSAQEVGALPLGFTGSLDSLDFDFFRVDVPPGRLIVIGEGRALVGILDENCNVLDNGDRARLFVERRRSLVIGVATLDPNVLVPQYTVNAVFFPTP